MKNFGGGKRPFKPKPGRPKGGAGKPKHAAPGDKEKAKAKKTMSLGRQIRGVERLLKLGPVRHGSVLLLGVAPWGADGRWCCMACSQRACHQAAAARSSSLWLWMLLLCGDRTVWMPRAGRPRSSSLLS